MSQRHLGSDVLKRIRSEKKNRYYLSPFWHVVISVASRQTWRYIRISSDIQNLSSVLYRQHYSTESLHVIAVNNNVKV